MKLTILGAGPGGYVAAIKAAQIGAEVTVIEKEEVGGTCLNWGCIPTKTILATTELLHKFRNAEEYGIEVSGQVIPNLSKIMERKNKVVSTQIRGIRSLFKSWGISLIEGKGMILTPEKIEVERKDGSTEIVGSDKIIIATGSKPAQLPLFPFDGEHILSSDDAVTIKSVPKSLIIIGAGVIGCEFASIFRELGTEVTMLEILPRAISTEEPEISEILERELKKKGIKLLTGVKVTEMKALSDGIHVFLEGDRELVAEKLLVSVGRSLNTEGIGLEAVGIRKGLKGEIVVNDMMETNIGGIYAIGDVIGGLLLAHVASREGITAAKNVMGADERMDYHTVPVAIFTSPEIASVGLREAGAIERGMKVKNGYFQFRALGKAHVIGEIAGFIKIISEEVSDRILGVHIIGPHASDLIHEAALAVNKGLKAKDISETIHTHPTLSEGIMEAAEDVHGEAIHIPKKSK
ncbi:MAG: dihydrolipoyl dehydrogenase [Nitrospirota bacterium]